MSEEISVSLRAQLALERAGFKFSHSLGQNFIFDEGLLDEIARIAGAYEGTNVLEIGPGAGMLTYFLASRGANVLSVELDRGLEGVLNETVGNMKNVSVVFGDAMKLDLNGLIKDKFGDAPFVIAANLPYYITADFMLKAVALSPSPESITVMVQSEAADRLLSRPGDDNWCALAAIVSFFCEGERALEVPRSYFTPSPHVDSALIRLDKRNVRAVENEDTAAFVSFIKAAFSMRRKTLSNCLSSAWGVSRENVCAALEKLGLDTKIRGEKLSVTELAQVFYELKGAK